MRESLRYGDGLRLYGERAKGAPPVSRPRTHAEERELTQRALRLLFMLSTTCSLRAASTGRASMDAMAKILVASHQGVREMLIKAMVEARQRGVSVDDLQMTSVLIGT
ncbi:MAG: hypothetical protein M3Q39_16830 [Actinomycetota bacterium]|nr:hypothetical protein [Actinomycetota bacterium]